MALGNFVFAQLPVLHPHKAFLILVSVTNVPPTDLVFHIENVGMANWHEETQVSYFGIAKHFQFYIIVAHN